MRLEGGRCGLPLALMRWMFRKCLPDVVVRDLDAPRWAQRLRFGFCAMMLEVEAVCEVLEVYLGLVKRTQSQERMKEYLLTRLARWC